MNGGENDIYQRIKGRLEDIFGERLVEVFVILQGLSKIFDVQI